MRVLLLTAATMAMLASQALAEPSSAPTDLSFWNGPYAGVLVGGNLASSAATTEIGCVAGAYLCDAGSHQDNGALIGATASGTATGVSPAAGVVAGMDWRTGNLVVGLAGALTLSPIALGTGGSAASINAGLAGSTFAVSATTSADWLATLTGRLGYVVAPSLLLYGTGGLATSNVTVANDYLDTVNEGGRGSSSASKVVAGYAVGGGVEWAGADGWLVRAEYLHVALPSVDTPGEISIAGAGAPNPFASEARLSANIVRAGLTHGF